MNNDYLQISWSSVTGANKYWIYYATYSGAPESVYLHIDTVPAPTTSYEDDIDGQTPEQVTNSTLTVTSTSQIDISWDANSPPTASSPPRYYKISAVGIGGEGAWSSESSGDAQVTPVITSYSIYRNGLFLGSSSSTTTTYNDTGLDVNTSYYYEISALSSDGLEGTKSSPISSFTHANPPGEVTTSVIDPTTIKVIIDANGNPVWTEFAIALSSDNWTTTNYVQTDGTIGTSVVWRTQAAWGGAGGQEVGIAAGTQYRIRARARNGDAVETDFGPDKLMDRIIPEVQEIDIGGNPLSVPVDIEPLVTFSEKMDKTSVEEALSLWVIKDNQGSSMSGQIPGTVVYTTSTQKATFYPDELLKKNYTYKLLVSTRAMDENTNPMSEEVVQLFRTVMDHTTDNVVTGDEGKTKVMVKKNTVDVDGYIHITDPLIEPKEVTLPVVTKANQRIEWAGNLFRRPMTVREFNIYTQDGERIAKAFSIPVRITFFYEDKDNDGLIDGTSPKVREKTLSVYRLDEGRGIWVRQPNSAVDLTLNTVSCEVNRFSVYTIIGNIDYDLSQAHAFPVPFRPNDGDDSTGTETDGITFIGLSSEAEIKIFTLSGELVKTLNESDGDGLLQWKEVANESGERLASGLYIYHIENERNYKSGKLIIIK